MTESATTDPYARIAEFYDLEHDTFAEDIPFYLNSISAVGDPVLELGCGTGRLLRPIARAGFRVTGLDASPAMLERATGTAGSAALRKRISLHQGAFSDAAAAPGGPFGVAIFSLNGLLHAATPEDQLAALDAVRAAMDPRGQVIIDLLNPTPAYLAGLDGGTVHEGGWESGTGEWVDKFSSRTVDASAQIIHNQIWYDLSGADGVLRRVRTSFDLRYLHAHELELMLRLTGYTSWQIYGDYELNPYGDGSDRLIVAAELS